MLLWDFGPCGIIFIMYVFSILDFPVIFTGNLPVFRKVVTIYGPVFVVRGMNMAKFVGEG
jgi:hypothetical protein